jgi:tetratricopeptide (TPR) repeat protein
MRPIEDPDTPREPGETGIQPVAGLDPRPPDEPRQWAESFFDGLERFLFADGGLRGAYGLSAEEVDDIATLGDQQLGANRLADAVTLYEGCLILDPSNPATLCRLATVRSLQGDAEGAAECLRHARDRCPEPGIVDELQRGLGLPSAAPG